MAVSTAELLLVIKARNEGAGALRQAGEQVRGLGEHLSHVAEMAAGFTLGAIGYSAISGAVGGIEELGKSLIETNATAEQLTQTFAAIYHSGAEAQQAMGWLTQFAMNAPFTREAIQQAGVTIAALGLDITQVLPALGNIAGVMGTDMPTAAQAFMDAFEGRFQMMQRDLHVSKQQLQEYGLEIDKSGKIVQSSLAPAFERFVAARYPEGMALQMQTFNGQMSNLKDHLQLIERTAGGAMFAELKTSLVGVIDYMNAHQSTILGLAAAFGQGLAGGMRAVGAMAQWLFGVIPPAVAIIETVWGRAQAAVASAGTGINLVQRGIATYLGQVVVPAVQTALGFVLQFWAEHGMQIRSILEGIGTNVQRFLAFLGSNFGSYLSVLKGEWQVAWGVIETVAGGALDLLSGNFDRFGVDWQKGWGDIWDGSTRIVEGGGEIMIRVMAGIFDKINQIEHTLYNENATGKGPFQALYDSVAALEGPMIQMVHGFFAPIFDAINNLMHAMHDISTSAVGKFAHLPALGWDKTTNLTMKDPNQAIKDIQTFAKTETHPLGWAPNVGLTHASVDDAIKRLRAQEQTILAQDHVYTGGGAPFTSEQAQKKGKDAFDAFIDSLKKMGAAGLTLPAGVDTTALLGGGVKALPVVGFDAPGDQASTAGKKGAGGTASPALARSLQGTRDTALAYGTSAVSFFGPGQGGGAQAEIAGLKRQLANADKQLSAQLQTNSLLAQQLAALKAGLGHARETAVGIGAVADSVTRKRPTLGQQLAAAGMPW